MTEIGGLKARLIRGGIGSLGMRLAQATLGLMISVMIARMLGPEGVGTYGTTLAILAVVLIPMQAGVARLLVREAPRREASADWEGLSGIFSWANRSVILFTVLCLTAMIGMGDLAAARADGWMQAIALGLAAAPVMAIGFVHSGILSGLKKVVRGQIFEVARNLLLLLLLAALPLVKAQITVLDAIILFGLANLGAAAMSVLLARRAIPQPARSAPPSGEGWNHYRQVVPFALMGGIWTVISSLDVIALRYLSTSAEVGYFHVANQICSLLLFGLAAIGLVASPYFSSMHAAGDRNALQLLARRSAQASLGFALPGAIFLWSSSAFLVPMVFGDEFSPSVWPITILAVGFVIQSSTGASGALLAMSGHEGQTINATLWAFGLKLVALLALAPTFGASGVAGSVVVYYLVFNLLVRRACMRHLGVEVFALR